MKEVKRGNTCPREKYANGAEKKIQRLTWSDTWIDVEPGERVCLPERRRTPKERESKGYITNLDDAWVDPFNPYLTIKFQADINCEIVNSVAAVK